VFFCSVSHLLIGF